MVQYSDFKTILDTEKSKYSDGAKIQQPLTNPIILVNGLAPNLRKFKKTVDKD
jgi:hypothetical protein